MTDTGLVEIHGKQYKTVALRLSEFWERHPDACITTELLDVGETVRIKALITDHAGKVMATGHAEEIRGATNILKTSALETCETSAIGRALGVFGLGGTAIASAEEMQLALEQQKDAEGVQRLVNHNEAVRDNLPSILAIKEFLAIGDFSGAYEAFAELDPDVVKAIWVAPTKGGIFATSERALMKSNEWNTARKIHHNLEDEE